MSTVFNAGGVTHSPQAALLAQQVFFPIAAVFAAVALWLLLISLSGKFGLTVDLPTHARGMLLGFVGALMAGVMWSANFIVVAYFSFFKKKGVPSPGSGSGSVVRWRMHLQGPS